MLIELIPAILFIALIVAILVHSSLLKDSDQLAIVISDQSSSIQSLTADSISILTPNNVSIYCKITPDHSAAIVVTISSEGRRQVERIPISDNHSLATLTQAITSRA